MGADSDSEERKSESLKSDSEENVDSDSDGSNLDKDPDVYLEEEQVDTKEDALVTMDTEDSRYIRDIRVGRMFRKKTNPMPVLAPVKQKLESTSASSSQQGETNTKVSSVYEAKRISSLVKEVENTEPNDFRSEKAGKVSTKDLVIESTEKKDYNNNDSGKEVEEDSVGQNNRSNLELDFSVKGGETLTQTVSVSKDGEELFTSTSRNTGPRFGDMKCNLEDLFGPGKVNLQDVNIEVQAGCLKLKIIKKA
ncbi:MAG: hypothetical protein AB2693_24920 [Candidatus Thiodiazotropha sp.]